MKGWTLVEDALPTDPKQRVRVLIKGNEYHARYQGRWYSSDTMVQRYMGLITHWQHIQLPACGVCHEGHPCTCPIERTNYVRNG